MANKIIKGRDLMLFSAAGKSYAYATNHTLSLSADSAEISSKDHGVWGASEITKISWEISTENLYTEKEYDKLFDAMVAAEPIKIKFGLKAETDNTKTVADGDYENWTPGTTYYEGSVIITSLEANAQNGDNATYSVTLTGASKIVRTTAGA